MLYNIRSSQMSSLNFEHKMVWIQIERHYTSFGSKYLLLLHICDKIITQIIKTILKIMKTIIFKNSRSSIKSD